MRYPKLRELCEAVRALLLGPYTHPFPKKPSPAAHRFRGKPLFDEEGCVGCGACAEVCPGKDITVTDDVARRKRTIKLRYDQCIFCGQCQANCLTGEGVRLTQDYDLVTFDRESAYTSVEKDLVLCEKCGAIVGARDHLLWLARKLGPKAYASPTLLVAATGELVPVDPFPRAPEDETPGRAHTLSVLCPKCRREVTVAELGGR